MLGYGELIPGVRITPDEDIQNKHSNPFVLGRPLWLSSREP